MATKYHKMEYAPLDEPEVRGTSDQHGSTTISVSFPLSINFASFDTFLDVPKHPHLVIPPFSLGNSWTPAWAIFTGHPPSADSAWGRLELQDVSLGDRGTMWDLWGEVTDSCGFKKFLFSSMFHPDLGWSHFGHRALLNSQGHGMSRPRNSAIQGGDLQFARNAACRRQEWSTRVTGPTCGRTHQVGIFRVGYLVRLSAFYHILPQKTISSQLLQKGWPCREPGAVVQRNHLMPDWRQQSLGGVFQLAAGNFGPPNRESRESKDWWTISIPKKHQKIIPKTLKTIQQGEQVQESLENSQGCDASCHSGSRCNWLIKGCQLHMLRSWYMD